MDNSFWARGAAGPAWPVRADGTKEKAVLLCRAADNTAGAEMTISLLAAWCAGMIFSIIAYKRSKVRQTILSETCKELNVDTPPKLR